MNSVLHFVSVFIPAYNAEPFVQQAIESVLAQTYLNYELIVINDASTDGTPGVINQYQHHPKVRIYHNSTNMGVARNWNRGVDLCNGDFIVRLDADDFYAPNYLAQVMAFFQKFPDIALVFTGANLLCSNNRVRQDLPYKESWVRNRTEFLPDLLQLCRIWSPCACVKRSCYERLGGVIEDMNIHEDWEMWVRVAATRKIGYLAEPLTNIRILNDNGCTNTAIVNARSPIACNVWLNRLADGSLPYQLTDNELTLLKKGMYELVMAFAAFALDGGHKESVRQHLAFARKLLAPRLKRESYGCPPLFSRRRSLFYGRRAA